MIFLIGVGIVVVTYALAYYLTKRSTREKKDGGELSLLTERLAMVFTVWLLSVIISAVWLIVLL